MNFLVPMLLLCVLSFSSRGEAQFSGSSGRRRGCPRLYLPNGRVRNKPRIFAQFSCNKEYVLLGERYSKCHEGQWDNPVPVCVKPSCKLPTQLVNGHISRSFNGAVIEFICYPYYTLHGPANTYCDGKSWSSYLPSCVRTNVTPSVSCDFETEDICGWTHSLNHDFTWERLNKKTPNRHVGTGPKSDHTKGDGQNGYYMYIESSYKNENDTARLISPIYLKQPNTRTCLEFYYHMFGSGIGQLRTYIKSINSSWTTDDLTIVHRIIGNQGDSWKRALVELGLINFDFQVIFEGVRGISFISDIAIDDVRLIENCNIEDLTITTSTEVVEMSTIMFESCKDRCFKMNETPSYPLLTIACDCDEDCSERGTCCPDFTTYCVIDYTTETTEDLTSLEDTTTVKVSTVSSSTSSSTTTKSTSYIIPISSTAKTVWYLDDIATFPTPMDTPKVPEEKTIPSTTKPNNSLTVKVVIVCSIGAFVILTGIFLLRRISVVRCLKMKKMRNSNGDSQSDVRFLTSDEILDFTLATPSTKRDY